MPSPLFPVRMDVDVHLQTHTSQYYCVRNTEKQKECDPRHKRFSGKTKGLKGSMCLGYKGAVKTQGCIV